MAVTVPTVQSSGDTHWNRMQDQTGASAISLGGGGVRSNNYLLDGFPVTDLQNRSSTNPSGEMVEDVRVQVHTYDAEMGRTGGGVLNTTAKSGVELVPRLGLLPEPSERADRPAVLQPDSRHRELAAVLARGSAAASAARSCSNKTFFWAAGEGYRDGLSQNDVMTVPTTAMRNGDFSGYRDAQGSHDSDLRPADHRTPPARASRSPATSFRRTASARGRAST